MGLNTQVAEPSMLLPMVVCSRPMWFPDSTDTISTDAPQVWREPSRLVSLTWCQPCCRCSQVSTTQGWQPPRLRPSRVVMPAFLAR